MSQRERARTEGPEPVSSEGSAPVESLEDLNLIRERIAAGEAFLKVVEYPWGVEFEVCGAEVGR